MGLLRDDRGPVTADEVFRTSFKGDSVILTKGTYTVLDGPLPGFSFSCYHLLVRGVAGLNLYYYDNGRGGTGIEKVKDLFEVASTSLSAASI